MKSLNKEEKTKTILHIELENHRVFWDLLKVDYKNYVTPCFKTPYTSALQSLDFEIPKAEAEDFIEFTARHCDTCPIKFYEKRSNHYHPIIIHDKGNLKLYTTFLYKMFADSEKFVSIGENIEERNFLENFEISKKRENEIEGYYRAITHIPQSDCITCTDTGTFSIDHTIDQNDHILNSKIKNIRIMNTSSQLNPYDILFDMHTMNGVNDFSLTEYYIPYNEETIIHFSPFVDFVEIYAKKDGEIELIPRYSFYKANVQNEYEEEILKIVEDFLQNKEYYIPYNEETIIHFTPFSGLVELYTKKAGKIGLKPRHSFNKANVKNEYEEAILKIIEKFLQRQENDVARKRQLTE